jgi:uncharacterized protein YdiU (UPF0061 family)
MNTVTDGFAGLDLGWTWRNRFAGLGQEFHTSLPPQPLPDPYWVGRSGAVAREIGLDPQHLESAQLLQALSGNLVPSGSEPVASVYSGHQFGVWAGQLGDGRALLLGETNSGFEIQLKGSGRTPYSRGGDGRAVLRSSIREFLCSEAMHALGVPTTRALCVTGSDQHVMREEVETAAVVTRVAPSFIRFGHFEHFSSLGQLDNLRRLADFVIDNYYPDCRSSKAFEGNPYAALLHAVTVRTAALLAQWQAVGFCHGVMNTDNMSILGLTIDYGPFQFLDAYDRHHICNHSDTQGRYAFNQQPNMAYWNLFCLGQALLPLIETQELALAALESYKSDFPDEFAKRMRAKLGLATSQSDDRHLIDDILNLLAQDRVDYTIFWRRLSHFAGDGQAAAVTDLFVDRPAAQVWLDRYTERLAAQDRTSTAQAMLQVNPKFVLRNHLGEQAIAQAKLKDFSIVHSLHDLLENPFAEHPAFEAYAGFPPDWASSIEISCSS